MDQLADDIRRHLDGRPVMARRPSRFYRAAKFVRRNRLAVSAAVALLLTVVASAVVSIEQARQADRQRAIALRERDQAQSQRRAAEREHARAEQERAAAVSERQRAEAESAEAQRQRTRAESRLHDLLDLANKSLYDVEANLARQEGATAARLQVVQATVNYLDRLAAAEGSDRELALAVVAGYLKMGDVLGRPRKPNLGKQAQALESYRKAWALLDRIRGQGDDLQAALLWIDIGDRLSVLEGEDVSNASSLATVNRVLPEARKLTARYPGNRDVSVRMAMLYQDLSDANATRNAPAAVGYGKQAIEIYESLVRQNPRDEDSLASLDSSYSQLAAALAPTGDAAGALEYARKSLAAREERLAIRPGDVLLRRDLMLSCTRVGDMLGGPFSQGGGGDEKAAYEYYRRAAGLAEGIAKADPGNQGAQNDYAIVLARLGGSLDAVAGVEESLRVLAQSAGMLEASLRVSPKVRINRITLCIADETMARRLEGLGRFEEALARARAEWELADALVKEQPDYRPARYRLMSGYELQSRLLAKLGRRDAALAMAQDASRAMAAYPYDGGLNGFYIAHAWVCLGDVYAIVAPSAPDPAADWRDARHAFEQGRGEWLKLGSLKGPFNPAREAADLAARLAEVDAHLNGARK